MTATDIQKRMPLVARGVCQLLEALCKVQQPSDLQVEVLEVLEFFNSLLGGFGVECLQDPGTQEVLAEYVNLGDTYDVTLLYDSARHRFYIQSWGDWMEAYETCRQVTWNERRCAYCGHFTRAKSSVCMQCGTDIL